MMAAASASPLAPVRGRGPGGEGAPSTFPAHAERPTPQSRPFTPYPSPRGGEGRRWTAGRSLPRRVVLSRHA